MPVPPGVLHVTFNTRLGGSEIALYGFHLWVLDVEAIGGDLLQQVADKVRDEWLDAFSTYKPVFSAAVTWESVRVDLLSIEAGPRYLKVQDSAFAPFAQSGEGSYKGTATTGLPWECAVVISYAAYEPGDFEVNKGRWRGRFYLPPIGVNSLGTVTGEMIEATAIGFADQFKIFFDALNGPISTEIDDEMRLAVLSRADDTVRVAQQVWCDSKVDSQRRRENRQPASFTGRQLLSV